MRLRSLRATRLGFGIQHPPRRGKEILSIPWLPGRADASEKEGSDLEPAEATGNLEKKLQDEVRANSLWHFLEVQEGGLKGPFDRLECPHPPAGGGAQTASAPQK